jgi:hypothetical protein
MKVNKQKSLDSTYQQESGLSNTMGKQVNFYMLKEDKINFLEFLVRDKQVGFWLGKEALKWYREGGELLP